MNLSETRDSLYSSLNSIHKFLNSIGLDLFPYKSKTILFSRHRKYFIVFDPLAVNGVEIPVVEYVKFLVMILDKKLNSVKHLKSLLEKRFKVVNIISLTSA